MLTCTCSFVIWFLALLVALVVGSFAITVLFGLIATIGGLQVAGLWKHRKVAVNQLVAGGGAGLMALGAWSSVRAAAVAIVAMAFAALVLGTDNELGRSSFTKARLSSTLPVASATLRSGLFLGLAPGAFFGFLAGLFLGVLASLTQRLGLLLLVPGELLGRLSRGADGLVVVLVVVIVVGRAGSQHDRIPDGLVLDFDFDLDLDVDFELDDELRAVLQH